MLQNLSWLCSPGVIAGEIMVDFAMEHMPEGVLFNALCETTSCLPDGIQLLTPCTIGNGWLTICSLGLFALSLYDKNEGSGIRVFLDPEIKWKIIRRLKAGFLK